MTETNTTESNTAEATVTEAPASETAAAESASPETPNPCLRELTIEIPADVVTTETDNLVNRYQKLARIPGFRKGKVPASVVRQRFAEDIKNEIVEALVPRYFREETQKQNLSAGVAAASHRSSPARRRAAEVHGVVRGTSRLQGRSLRRHPGRK